MATTRLEVRLDAERRSRLEELAEQRGAPVSEVVRLLIDDAYEQIMLERRRRAVERLISLQIEDMPDPEELSRQLESAYEPGGI